MQWEILHSECAPYDLNSNEVVCLQSLCTYSKSPNKISLFIRCLLKKYNLLRIITIIGICHRTILYYIWYMLWSDLGFHSHMLHIL